MKKFNSVEDLKQLKTDKELVDKCNQIIDSLERFTKAETYRILSTLYNSFIESCAEQGIAFMEIPEPRL